MDASYSENWDGKKYLEFCISYIMVKYAMKTTQFEIVFHIDTFAAILVESPFLAQNHCARWSTMKTNAGWRDGISSVYLFCMKKGADLISKRYVKHR